MYSPLCPVHKGYNSATVLHMPLYILIEVVETAAFSLRVPWLCSQYLAMWWLSHLHLPHFHDLFRHGNALSDMTFLWKEFLGRIRCKQVQSACCEGANAKKTPESMHYFKSTLSTYYPSKSGVLTDRKSLSVNRKLNNYFSRTDKPLNCMIFCKKKTALNLRIMCEKVAVSEQSLTDYRRIYTEVKRKISGSQLL